MDEMGRPIYGDVFGFQNTAVPAGFESEQVDKTYRWGKIEEAEESEEEVEEDEEMEEEVRFIYLFSFLPALSPYRHALRSCQHEIFASILDDCYKMGGSDATGGRGGQIV